MTGLIRRRSFNTFSISWTKEIRFLTWVADWVTFQNIAGGGGWKGTYTGLDISKGMAEAARKRLKTDDIHQVDILEDPYDRRHHVVASVATLQEKPPYQDPADYLEQMIHRMFQICTKCVVFDVFSNRFADYEKPGNIYVDPVAFLDKLYRFTNRLILYNHYNPFQLMVVLYKERLGGWRSERS